MDDFGVARAGVRAEGLLGLEHDDLAPFHRELAGNRQADDARADDGAFNSLCHNSGTGRKVHKFTMIEMHEWWVVNGEWTDPIGRAVITV